MREEDVLQFGYSPRWSLLGRFFDALPVGAGLALDGKIAYANPACARIFGYPDGASMLSIPLFELIDPEFHPFLVRLWNLRASGVDPWTYDLYGKRADGSAFPYRVTSVAFDTTNGKASFAYHVDLSGTPSAPTREALHARHECLIAELLAHAE